MNLQDVKETWESVGRDDPLWGVLSWEGTEGGRWNPDALFKVGEDEVATFLEQARVVGATPHFGSALDFGCGVGRLSRALASRFEVVYGVDISTPMVEQAERLVGSQLRNCHFTVSASDRLPYADGYFDFILSNIVLQHTPPNVSERYIREFLRVLAPDGVAVFQVPAEHRHGSASRRPAVRAVMNALPSQVREEIMRRRGGSSPSGIPMYAIPRAKVLRRIKQSGARTLACIEDTAAGENWASFHYIVMR